MPSFEYAARDEQGHAISGEIKAPSRNDAAKLLRAEGKFIVRLHEMEDPSQAQSLSKRGVGRRTVSQDQVIYFANQLAVMVDTGVPLADALVATIQDEPISGFRAVVEDIIEQVQGGHEFSASLARHPKAFPKYFCNIIRASEATGLLGPMLHRIAKYMTYVRNTKKRIKRAMAYPIAMVVFAITVTAFLLIYLIPRFERIFKMRGAALPRPTQILMETSKFLSHNWFWLVPLTVFSIFLILYFLKTPSGYRISSWLKLNTPIIGPMFRKACISRCMRTMGTLIDAGISMLDSVMLTREMVENYYYEQLLIGVDQKLQKGHLLSDALKDSPLFPHSVVQMVLAGERAGQLGPVMDRVAEFSEKDLEGAVKTATQMIEPMLVIFMGSFVGGIAIALLLPIFSLSRVVSNG